MIKIKLPKNPKDKFTIEYFSIDGNDITKCRLTYYKSTPWHKHPWSQTPFYKNRIGGDFINEWTYEDQEKNKWVGRGRSNEGWKSAIEKPLSSEYNFSTLKEAKQDLKRRFKNNIERLEVEIKNAKESIDFYNKYISTN